MPNNGLGENSESHLQLNQKRSPYFVGKVFGEEFVKHVCNAENINYLIIRPFNIYGPNMDRKTNYSRVIPNFISRALKKQPLEINGHGIQERSFCFIDDFIDAMISLLKHQFPPEKLINIGNPEPISILKLADMINEILSNPSKHIFTNRYEFEPQFRTPNIDRITNLISWRPKIKLEKGIRKTIESFK